MNLQNKFNLNREIKFKMILKSIKKLIYKKIINALNNKDKILYLSEKDFINPTAPINYYWK
jgi:hypothetical protein